MNEQNFYLTTPVSDELSFSDISRKETSESTHAYHKYPAKFIPQLARTLIESYTFENELVWDPFCGSGTLNVEAFRIKRNSIGTDINPISIIISRAKTTPIEPELLEQYFDDLLSTINNTTTKSEEYYEKTNMFNGNLEVLKSWFSEDNLVELAHILDVITKKSTAVHNRDFALCAFSSILKRSSYWLNSSVKAQIDKNKNPANPLKYFERQLCGMKQKNLMFYQENINNHTKTNVYKHNAKHKISNKYGTINSIITSPPYLISYDYSDIFRLSTYFLHYHSNYQHYRKSFVGTTLLRNYRSIHVLPNLIMESVSEIDDTCLKRTLLEYYKDMQMFFKNASHCLSDNGNLVLIVGDTHLRGVNITNAYYLYEIAISQGLEFVESKERKISTKILPSTRDKTTGRFSSRNNSELSEIYNKEYILVFRKKNHEH